MIEEMKVQLQAERESGIPNEAQLQNDLNAAAQNQVNRLKGEGDQAKAQAKRRKSEVDEWKQWYYSLPGLDKTAELEKLNAEIGWRTAEIDTLQTQIAAIDIAFINAIGLVENLKHKLAAVEACVYLLSVAQDPRLIRLS